MLNSMKKGGENMLAELKMEIQTDNTDFGYYQSSNMQGVLMENIDTSYAAYLHEQRYNPYSQHLEMGDKKYWVIKTLKKEAYEQMILPLLDSDFQDFELKRKNIQIKINKKELKIQSKKELLDRFYSKEVSRIIQMELMTPTSFKSSGEYIIMPDLRLLYQNLMNKYSYACEDMEMCDESILEELSSKSKIINYRLNSVFFEMERVKIPSFRGKMGIKINGTDTMAKYARLLMEFGEYAGVGIKTAMGMGAMRIVERSKQNER